MGVNGGSRRKIVDNSDQIRRLQREFEIDQYRQDNEVTVVSGSIPSTLPLGSITSGAAGSIPFSDGSALTEDASNLHYDDGNDRLGVGTNSPASTIDSAGSVAAAIETVTAASVTLDDTNYTVLCNCSSNAITVNLPTAVSSSRRIYHIKKIDSTANSVTIDGDGSETVDGSTTQSIALEDECLTIQSNGTEWFIL